MSGEHHRGGNLLSCLRSEAEAGAAQARDPANANVPDLGLRITTLHSAWFTRRCRVCLDKFREGDQVRLCPKCHDAFHDDDQYHLRCWSHRFSPGNRCGGGPHGAAPCDFTLPTRSSIEPHPGSDRPASPGTDASTPDLGPLKAAMAPAFLSGLETVWRPFGSLTSLRVEVGSRLVGRACPWCRFRVRAGDWVVACPCACGGYFHQDVFRHLTCWNSWNGAAGHDYCPWTLRRFKDPAHG